jgi:hypothetical protein
VDRVQTGQPVYLLQRIVVQLEVRLEQVAPRELFMPVGWLDTPRLTSFLHMQAFTLVQVRAISQ